MSDIEDYGLAREIVTPSDIVLPGTKDIFVQTDKSTLMAFMRTMRVQREHADTGVIKHVSVTLAVQNISAQPRQMQNDRTTLRAAMDRMAESRNR